MSERKSAPVPIPIHDESGSMPRPRRLILQGEQGKATSTGHWLGAEVFHDPDEGFYTARFHARTYEGVQVQSSHNTGEIRLDAENEAAAITEAEAQFVEFQKLYEKTAEDS